MHLIRFQRTVRVWNLETDESIVLQGHQGQIYCVEYDGFRTIVSGGHGNEMNGKISLILCIDKTIRVWSIDGESLHVFSGHTDLASCLLYNPKWKRIISASNDCTGICSSPIFVS